jgi:hypothetical protein
MFVSSYNTYIQTNNSDKISKERTENLKLGQDSFSAKLNKVSSDLGLKTSSIPVNYISQKQILHNKQEIRFQEDKLQGSIKNNIDKFKNQNILMSSKSAYDSNSKMFSLYRIPQVALNQTPSIDNTLPKEPRDIKELNMRHKMVNTYMANDNYYKITAA